MVSLYGIDQDDMAKFGISLNQKRMKNLKHIYSFEELKDIKNLIINSEYLLKDKAFIDYIKDSYYSPIYNQEKLVHPVSHIADTILHKSKKERPDK